MNSLRDARPYHPWYPRLRLIAYFSTWKALLLCLAALSPGPGYDTSTALLRRADPAPYSHKSFSHVLEFLIGKLVKWDAVYFTEIARRGYVYEQEWAFGWGHTKFLSLISQSSNMANIDGIAVIGTIVAHACHLLSVLVLYELTLIVWSGTSSQTASAFAFLSATLHIISPAGLFLSAPYAESSFALLNFTGFYLYSLSRRSHSLDVAPFTDIFLLFSGFTIGIATTFRGNGLFGGLIFVWDALETLWLILQTLGTVETDFKVVKLMKRLIITGFSGVMMACVALVPQYIAYSELCVQVAPNSSERPWCNATIPSIYAWVQKEYWGVGFLRYWNMSNLPLFLLATPMLVIVFLSSKWAWEARQNTVQLVPALGVEYKPSPTVRGDSPFHSQFNQAMLRRLALPQIVLGLLALTTYHVQIITRLSSGYPIWYWWLASSIMSGKEVELLGQDGATQAERYTQAHEPETRVEILSVYGKESSNSHTSTPNSIKADDFGISKKAPRRKRAIEQAGDILSSNTGPVGRPVSTVISCLHRNQSSLITHFMEGDTAKMAELLASMQTGRDGDMDSRATSPGPGAQESEKNEDHKHVTRSRPRTYPYYRYLPYDVESEAERQRNLNEILEHLYVSIQAGDFGGGAVHWTRELRNWLSLKFDPTKDQRIRLVKLYYELALSPGVDPAAVEKFSSTFDLLLKRKHYLRRGIDLTLDWRPIFRELKIFVIPSESGMVQTQNVKRNYRTLAKMCAFAQLYFDPQEIPSIFEELLPYFTTSFTEGAFVVAGLLNLLFPTSPPPAGRKELLPQHYLPTLFHIWSLVNRSKVFDTTFLDLFSRLARDHLVAPQTSFSECGIYTQEQSSTMFTAILRLLEIPVGQATSPYSGTLDAAAGLAVYLERDPKKHPVAHHIARWIVMSLSPVNVDKAHSIMSNLEGLVQAVDTFFHPSNSGGWTRTLSQLVYYLCDFFVMRWNRERSGEMEIPEDRKLDDALKHRFVLCLREVVFMGIYAKSGVAMDYSLSSLQSLAYLEPSLMLPGALQRIYPSMQGLVEVHRTTSSLRALQVLSKILVRTKGFRCHVTTLLGLALPGIDANDLDKTLYTLSFIQSVCYNIPFQDMTEGRGDVAGNMLAMKWITSEVTRMEQEGVDVGMNYEDELSDEDEELILRSSTASFAEFLSSFLGKVFTLLENLPDAARARTGSPEENVINTLPATFLPLLASLSPDLYDVALNKIADFVAKHVIHQARDAMAFICGALAKIYPEKALKRLIPVLIGAIRTEIDENGAASTRNTGNEVLPRDRGLVWNVSMLSMCVVHVGDAVLQHRQELFDVALFMQQKCQGTPTLHVSNFSHHTLLNLTGTYTVDWRLYEEEATSRGIGPQHWGAAPDPQNLNIKWHVPSREECQFALDLVKGQGSNALGQLKELIAGTSAIKRDGVGKEWSDEISRNLMLIRLLLSGVSVLFDPKDVESTTPEESDPSDTEMADENNETVDREAEPDDEAALANNNDDEIKPTFRYPAGYVLDEDDQLYEDLHDFRNQVGQTLHEVHQFLVKHQEDDVACFGPLYTAYRSWFVDVGLERSAKVLNRNTRLLAADIHPYKLSGLRKQYPRPLLVRRALVYHLQRLRHNSYPRPKTDMAKQLLFDLAESAISLYTEVRRHAQSAGESAFKAVIGSRTLVIPTLLAAFEKGVKETDFPRIKGAMYSLLFSTLTRPIGRDWRYAPSVIKTYLAASTADKPSIQRLCSTATISIMEIGRPLERMAILDKEVIQLITPDEDVRLRIEREKGILMRKREAIEKKKAILSEELVDMARKSHWKQASRTAAIVITLGMRFDSIASENMTDLVTRGAIDEHPGLRGLYCGAFTALLSLVETRAVAGHSYEDYLLNKPHLQAKIKVDARRDDPGWTDMFLAKFAKPEAEYYVDHDHPGWLVWSKTMPAYKADPEVDLEYDETENKIRAQIGSLLDRNWFSKTFSYMKQEPRDTAADRFHVSSSMLLAYTFELMYAGITKAKLSDIKAEIETVYGDGTDKHQHRATAEILGGLLTSTVDKTMAYRTEIWEYAFPIFQKIFSDGLTPENVSYWTTFLHLVLQGKDPRRCWPVIDWLASFRLDMDSNAAFKESSKIRLLQQCVSDMGWHFQLDKPITADFLNHIDHPYKGVREAMGQSLSTLYSTRYHESYKDVQTLIKTQREASSLGTRPYEPTAEFTRMIHDIFERIERWRQERTPGQQTPSSYTSGSKTVLLWLDTSLASYECTQFIKFFPSIFLEHLLHMMDIKEDQELQGLAYHVFRHIPNIPHRIGEDSDLIAALIRIGRSSALWHQRLRVLINMQVIYFRRLFLISRQHQQNLFDCVANMLEDSQLEVRMGASSTLSGMVRCSPEALRSHFIDTLNKKFTKMLIHSPLPKRAKVSISTTSTGTSTPTQEHTKLVLTRHAAVLGLGALVQAFPYSSPPPKWVPGVLATLASKANNDPGMVGKSVKSILSDFKKTRQDTWQIDLKIAEAWAVFKYSSSIPPRPDPANGHQRDGTLLPLPPSLISDVNPHSRAVPPLKIIEA
ncbi:MAG: hypothetical protein Q9217_003258 [Psora testacea]